MATVGDNPARRVWRGLRPRRSILRVLPHVLLLVALTVVSSWSAAGIDGSTAEAATTRSSVIRPIRPCGQLTTAHLISPTGVPVRFVSARLSNFTGAEYCHVIGDIGTGFYFDLRLPQTTYQGQYLQEGCGGFCGFLYPSLPLVADDCPAVTGNTLALAVDDEGHVTTTNTDARWAANDAKSRTIFGSTSEHQLAVVAKTLIAAYYGHGPAYSYFDGCSDGGREALIEAQRYPQDFNGILARRAGQPPDGANRRGFELEHQGEHRTWGPRDSHVREAPGAPRSGGTGMWPGTGIRNGSSYLQFLPVEHRVPRPGHQFLPYVRAGSGRHIVLPRPSDPAGQSLYPGGEPYGSELGWSAWFVKPLGDRDGPKTRRPTSSPSIFSATWRTGPIHRVRTPCRSSTSPCRNTRS